MIPRSTHHRIQIATVAEVAARSPFPAGKEGASRYRTRGVCHSSTDKPASASLIFHDPDQSKRAAKRLQDLLVRANELNQEVEVLYEKQFGRPFDIRYELSDEDD